MLVYVNGSFPFPALDCDSKEEQIILHEEQFYWFPILCACMHAHTHTHTHTHTHLLTRPLTLIPALYKVSYGMNTSLRLPLLKHGKEVPEWSELAYCMSQNVVILIIVQTFPTFLFFKLNDILRDTKNCNNNTF